ncbi:hypothetical protein VTK73DRAFT_6142 [Phialemonium thermophilum]|uniref:Uncharacterized protein n=1 Tax=Phialemonium thermophilum TaxID=223376 RepID=A0ABR3V188_9PEZI
MIFTKRRRGGIKPVAIRSIPVMLLLQRQHRRRPLTICPCISPSSEKWTSREKEKKKKRKHTQMRKDGQPKWVGYYQGKQAIDPSPSQGKTTT